LNLPHCQKEQTNKKIWNSPQPGFPCILFNDFNQIAMSIYPLQTDLQVEDVFKIIAVEIREELLQIF